MEYSIRLDTEDFPVLSAALVELPYKISAPLIDKINKQIVEQDAQRNTPKNAESGKVQDTAF